jgi:predicted site-specific integrase-resolvase
MRESFNRDSLITMKGEEELIRDLISIIHVFSYRIYELRKYKKEIANKFDMKIGDDDEIR